VSQQETYPEPGSVYKHKYGHIWEYHLFVGKTKEYWGWYVYNSYLASWRPIGAVPKNMEKCSRLEFLLVAGMPAEEVPFDI
jgi:hypothetical protein